MFEAYVTNLGLYPERGAGAGEYLKFPTTVEEVQALFSQIGIDGKQYEEYFITDYDSDILGLTDHLGEYESLDELNYLAHLLEEMTPAELEKLEAAGMVHKVPTEEGALYQCCPHPQPDHGCILLRCEACGRITHLECIQMEALCRHLETAHHFCMDPRRTILTGRCQHCAQEDAYGTP